MLQNTVCHEILGIELNSRLVVLIPTKLLHIMNYYRDGL